VLHFEILVPVFNEEDAIGQFFESVEPVLDAVENLYDVRTSYKFLDNLSTDQTKKVLQKWKTDLSREIHVLTWVRNYGVMNSIYGGLRISDADVIMVIDVDLQDPARLIMEFYGKYKEGYSFVAGRRNTRVEPHYKTLGRFVFRALYRILKKDENLAVESGAWLLDRAIIEDLSVNPPTTNYLSGTLTSRGYRRETISYDRAERLQGKSKFSIFKYGTYAFEGLASSPTRLMRFALFTSILLNIFVFIFFIYFIIAKYFFGLAVLQGVTLLFFVQVFSLSITVMLLGLIGEYVSRIFQNTARLEIPIVLSEL